MKRSVILMGGKTYIISLPAPWIKRYGIKKGTELDVEESGSSIIISTNSGVFIPERFEIDITDFEPILAKVLANIYKNGYPEILIKSSKPELLRKVEGYFNKYFIGLEVVKLEKNLCLIKQISSASSEEFNNLFRRVFSSINSMQEKVFEGIKMKDTELLKESVEQDKVNNNMLALCKYMLNIRKYSPYRNTTYMYCLCEALQNLADEHKLIAEYIMKKKPKLKDELKSYEKTVELFKRFYDLYYNYDKQNFVEVTINAKNLRNGFYLLFNTKFDQRLLYSLTSIADLIHEMLSFKLSMEL